jgi:hypothetical protein
MNVELGLGAFIERCLTDGSFVRVSPVHAMRSESRLIPDQPLVQIVAKVSGEPKVANAALSSNVRFHVAAC